MDLNLPIRACGRCRQRRVKCDKNRPACHRCQKLSQPCPGYDTKRKFLDTSEDLRKRYGPQQNQTAPVFNTSRAVQQPPVQDAGSSWTVPQVGTANAASPNDLQPSSVRVPAPRGSLTLSPSNNAVAPQIVFRNIQSLPDHQYLGHTEGMANLNEQMDLGLEQSFFDIDPELYYGAHNNSCGFFPGVAPIISEIDQASIDELTIGEEFGSDIWHTPESGINPNNPEADAPCDPIHSKASLNEMSYLTLHFAQVIGPWMDLLDMNMYFSRVAPLRAMKNSLLRSCIVAIASKQLGRITANKGDRSLFDQQSPKPIVLRLYPDITHNEWFFKAASYYDKAISYLRIHLQHTDVLGRHRSIDDPVSAGYEMAEQISTPEFEDNGEMTSSHQKRSQPSNKSSSGLNSDDLLVAVSILSEYEFLDHYERALLQHLSGLHTLLKNERRPQALPSLSTEQLPDFSRAHKAAFWNFARVDCATAYSNRTRTRLDTEDLALWRAAGIQVTTDGGLYTIPDEDITVMEPTRSEDLASRTLIWILLQILNMVAEDDDLSPDMVHSRNNGARSNLEQCCNRLQKLLDTWYETLPNAFKPFAKINRTDPRSADEPAGGERFAEVLFSVPNCGAVLQLYHFARILLLLKQPLEPKNQLPGLHLRRLREVSHRSEFHSRKICGLALGNTKSTFPAPLIQPLYLAGLCLEADNDKKLVLDLLQLIEKETGCSTNYRRQDLRSQWGWDG